MNSEFDVIDRYFTRPRRNALLGPGDDAALIACKPGMDWAISVDTLVAGRHFFPDVDPATLGHKVLAVNLSDMAAMGATPCWATLSLTLTKTLAQDDIWLKAFSSGFFALADQYQVELIGGDTTGGPLNISVQIIGEVERGKALRRSGAQPGDDIWVSGHLGDAALALQSLQQHVTLTAQEAAPCLAALHTPMPRVALGKALVNMAHSAIDISDGLLADLGHILDRSGVAATIDFDHIPRSPALKNKLQPENTVTNTTCQLAIDCLLAGGDDYELCFTVPESKRDAVIQLAQESGILLSRIGKIIPGKGLTVLGTDSNPLIFKNKGYDHFSAR
ncbi:MAG TPA: thiamine-phosphate kinase [Nitrosomonas europaea]|uniref:thiamine-phosphate kinase n=1 Tax=Nitrosomonas europaea TaxID=915 RepID=UPI002B6A9474|nr:thiamine-phosphate kinase [Nitrosomonas europaea]HUM72632.1 thiamine-phosphate kinase [Nitrosomonas europaea]